MIPYVLGLNNKLLLSIFFISIELLYDFSIFFLYCKHTLYYGDCARERILFMVYSVYKYIHWMLNSINCVLPLFWFLFLWVNRFLFVIYLFVSDANCVNFIWMCLCERCILFVLANYFIIDAICEMFKYRFACIRVVVVVSICCQLLSLSTNNLWLYFCQILYMWTQNFKKLVRKYVSFKLFSWFYLCLIHTLWWYSVLAAVFSFLLDRMSFSNSAFVMFCIFVIHFCKSIFRSIYFCVCFNFTHKWMYGTDFLFGFRFIQPFLFLCVALKQKMWILLFDCFWFRFAIIFDWWKNLFFVNYILL